MLAARVGADVPRRIISGMPSITEMLFALGIEDQVVGVTTNCDHPSEALAKEKIGGFFLNLEKVVSLDPDLIIMVESAQETDIKKFKNHGLPVHAVDPNSVIEIMETMVELGELTGAKERAEEFVAGMNQRIRSLEERIGEFPSPKTVVIVGYKPLIVAGSGNYIDDVLRYAGAENPASDAGAAYPQYSFEKLLEDDPDYIIIPRGLVKKKEIESDARWQILKAVKNDRILFIDADILSRPGPRVMDAIEEIAGFIHEKET